VETHNYLPSPYSDQDKCPSSRHTDYNVGSARMVFLNLY